MKKNIVRLLLLIVSLSISALFVPQTATAVSFPTDETRANPDTFRQCQRVTFVVEGATPGEDVHFRFFNSDDVRQVIHWVDLVTPTDINLISRRANAVGRVSCEIRFKSTHAPGSYYIQATQGATVVKYNVTLTKGKYRIVLTDDFVWADNSRSLTINVTDECGTPKRGETATISFNENNLEGDTISASVLTNGDGDAFPTLNLINAARPRNIKINVTVDGQTNVLELRPTRSADIIQRSRFDFTLEVKEGRNPFVDGRFKLELTDMDTSNDVTFDGSGLTTETVWTDASGRASFRVAYPDDLSGSTYTITAKAKDTTDRTVDIIVAVLSVKPHEGAITRRPTTTTPRPSTPTTTQPTTTTNNAPVFSDGTSTTRTIAENTAANTNIGTAIAATDTDNDTLTYTLGGTDAASFGIVSATGQLQTKAALDYEGKNAYTVTVSVSDGNGGSDSITVTISVTDIDETPQPTNNAPVFTDGASTTRTVAENTASGQNIGTAIAATDADTDTLTYTLGGTDAGSFGIISTTGQLQTSAALNFANKASYSVTVSVSDGRGGSDSITVTINVTNVQDTLQPTNNAPVFTDGDSTTRTVSENTAANTNIGTAIAATDADSGDTLTYTLGGTDAAAFGIVSTSGQLQTNAALDYENKASYTVTVGVSDGRGGSDSITVTINVTDIDETPQQPVQEPALQQGDTATQKYVVRKGKLGQLVLSEFMFESTGGLHSLPQWVEVYNTTNTDINIRGWQLEWYRREPKLLDVTTTFETDFVIPAKSARVIVSVYGRNSGNELDTNRGTVYSLFSLHGILLDQNDGRNRNRLISRGGFYLKLLDGDDTLIDQIGTVTDKVSEPAWELPECNIKGVRSSLIRRFNDNTPRKGTERKGWIRAYDTKARPTGRYYGKQTDIGSPAYRSSLRPLPVTLSYFRAEQTDAGVLIKWTTESEVDNAGFYLYRSQTKTGEFKVINPKLIKGAGTTGRRTEYRWTDTTAKPNTVYYYRIADISYGGVIEQLATVQLRGFVSATDKQITTWSELKRTPTF